MQDSSHCKGLDRVKEITKSKREDLDTYPDPTTNSDEINNAVKQQPKDRL